MDIRFINPRRSGFGETDRLIQSKWGSGGGVASYNLMRW